MIDLTHFTNREQARSLLETLWENPTPWTAALIGQTGQGKSALMHWFQSIHCINLNIPCIYLNLAEPRAIASPGFIFFRLAETLAHKQVLPYKVFQNYQEVYNQRLEEVSNLPTCTGPYQPVRHSPFALQSMRDERLSIRNDKEWILFGTATSGWLECLRNIPNLPRLAILFDHYEEFQNLAGRSRVPWFWKSLERTHEYLPGLRVVLSSQKNLLIQEGFQAVRKNLVCQAIEGLNLTESTDLMKSIGVKDEAYIRTVFENITHGNPLLVELSAHAWIRCGGIPAEQVPSFRDPSWGIEWLLRRFVDALPDRLQQILCQAASLRDFEEEHLLAMLQNGAPLPGLEEPICDDEFRELVRMPLISLYSKPVRVWGCHPEARRVLVPWFQQELPQQARIFHRKADSFYYRLEKPGESLYHTFLHNPKTAYRRWCEQIGHAALSFDHTRMVELIQIGFSPELPLAPAQRARVHLWNGFRLFQQEDPDAALESCRTALQSLDSGTAESSRGDVLFVMAQIQGELCNYPTALENCQSALEMYEHAGDLPGTAAALRLIGELYRFNKDFDTALENDLKAEAILRQINFVPGLALIHKEIGYIYQLHYEFDQAMQYYTRALDDYKASHDPYGQAQTLYLLGGISERLHDNRKALQSWHEAFNLFRSCEDNHDIAKVCMAYGGLELNWKNYPEAYKHFCDALALYRTFHNRLGEAQSLQALAFIWKTGWGIAGKQESADLLLHAIDIFREIGERDFLAGAMVDYAHLLVSEGRLSESLKTALEAQRILNHHLPHQPLNEYLDDFISRLRSGSIRNVYREYNPQFLQTIY